MAQPHGVAKFMRQHGASFGQVLLQVDDVVAQRCREIAAVVPAVVDLGLQHDDVGAAGRRLPVDEVPGPRASVLVAGTAADAAVCGRRVAAVEGTDGIIRQGVDRQGQRGSTFVASGVIRSKAVRSRAGQTVPPRCCALCKGSGTLV